MQQIEISLIEKILEWVKNMCLKWFKKQPPVTSPSPPVTTPPVVAPPAPAPLKLLHPEEPRNSAATLDSTSISDVLCQWFTLWNVPAENQEYFRTAIVITLVNPLMVPDGPGAVKEVPADSYAVGNVRHLDVEPAWLNPGVIAHEQAHNSYALLTNDQKAAFTAAFDSLKNTDPKLVYLWSVNNYGLSSDVEGHAETYRYWGSEMPPELISYYPKLF